MDDLIQSKMHEALEVEQPDSGLRSRILSSLPTDNRSDLTHKSGATPMGRRTELAAGIAAVLLAALVIGSFAYIRAVTRPQTVAPPVTSPLPSPLVTGPPPTLAQPLNASPSAPVILFRDAGSSFQVDGMTWDGRLGMVAQIPSGGDFTDSGEASNPAGTLFVSFPNILNRAGHAVAKLAGGPYADPAVGMYFVGTWADDELHYCQVVPIFGGANPVAGTLQLTTPGGVPHNVAQVGMQDASTNSLTVTACSVVADRAVVVHVDPNPGPGGQQLVTQYWVVQLSNGRVLWTHDVNGKGITNVVASRDGRYLAEVQSSGTTTIYGANGSQVGQANGYVQTFSWDGSLAVVVTGGGLVTVVRWGDGTVVWTAPPLQGLSGFQAEPGGSSLAILTANSTLYVVSSDGRVVAQAEVRAGGLLGCPPRDCATIPATGSEQVLPQVMVGNAGWGDGLLHTTDGGVTWQNVSPSSPPNTTKGGYATYAIDADHAWQTLATGPLKQPLATQLAVFATADGGRTWTPGGPVPVNGAGSVTDRLDFIDAQHGWLLTDSGTETWDRASSSIISQPRVRAIYQTIDGGLNWSRLASEQEGGGAPLGTLNPGCSTSGLTFVNQDQGWLTWDCNSGNGPSGPSQSSTSVAVTRDGGRTWQPVALPSFPGSGDFTCSASSPVFTGALGALSMNCGGTSQAGFSAVYATSDAGRSWNFRKLPFFSQGINFVDAETGWALGGTGRSLYRTTNGGRSWALIKQFATEQSVTGFRFLDSRNGFVRTSRYSPDRMSGYSTMWKTTDGGLTWSVMSTVPTGPPF